MIISQTLDKECIECNAVFTDPNKLRQHRELVHGGCAYCIKHDLSLEHVIKQHKVCVFCHQLGSICNLFIGYEYWRK